MASTYNPYSDIEKVFNAKIGWNNATTDEERKKQEGIANSARATLKAYGYGDVADQISASGADATATRKILEKYAPAPTVETNNLKSNEVNRENDGLFKKYNQEYEDLKNTNPFTTAEAKAIMAKYDLAGLQGRDNAVASGGASNGGNIDSYASANAMRQQASLVNQGQMTVLESHQQKIDNIRGLLSDMGVNIDRVFNQDETSKNNETARLVEEANVTGYTPSAWTIKNDDVYSTYLNENGTFKKEMENIDIQALIDSAKSSGDTDTANKLAVVRAKKILGNWDSYGQYANEGDISHMKPQITEQRRQSEQNDALARETLGVEKEINALKNANDITKAMIESGSNNGGVVVDENGNVVVSGENTPQTEVETIDFTDNFVEDSDGKLAAPTEIDTTDDRYTKSGLNDNGKAFVEKILKYASRNAGILTKDEFVEYIVGESQVSQINVKQLKSVLAYLGLNNSIIDEYGIKDAATWYNPFDGDVLPGDSNRLGLKMTKKD